MVIRFILLFTIVPLIELYLLIQVGKYLGVLPTIAVVFITGIMGGLLARSQGLSIYRRIQMDLQNGTIPTDSLIDGLFILIAGALLITPGLITDIVGFLVMIPAFRGWLRKRIKERFKHKLEAGQMHFYSNYHSTDWRKDDDL